MKLDHHLNYLKSQDIFRKSESIGSKQLRLLEDDEEFAIEDYRVDFETMLKNFNRLNKRVDLVNSMYEKSYRI